MKDIQISIVVPLFNESQTIPFLKERLDGVLNSTELSIEVVLVDDGSKDNTLALIKQMAFLDSRYQVVSFSRNFGHPMAISAGMACARGKEGVFIIDGDLQDPPELLFDFYQKFKEGYEVVYGVRKKRKESFLKKAAYNLFYRILKKISYIDVPLDSGDFSFVSRKVVDILNKMPEESRYVRGMRAWIGFQQTGLEYERDERIAGNSKYTFKQLIKLANNGVFNFSYFPIKFVKRIGYMGIASAFLFLVYTLIKKYYFGIPIIEGYTSLLLFVLFFSSLQFIAIGLIGEYILRIFFQSKGRPLYIINEHILDSENSNS